VEQVNQTPSSQTVRESWKKTSREIDEVHGQGNYKEDIKRDYIDNKTISTVGTNTFVQKAERLHVENNSNKNKTLRRHLEQQLNEQQQEYEYKNEEIEFLRHSEKLEELRPKERFRLKQQIAEVKQKRDEIFQSIEELEKKLNL